jgi:futalosine hydrolase
MSHTLVLIPTELELSRLADAGGFPAGTPVEVCGFGPIAAAARSVQLIEQWRPARVLLVGIAGSFDPARYPIGTAWSFAQVRIEGIGAGMGLDLQGPAALGFPQLPARGEDPAVVEELDLSPAARTRAAGLLLTTCAASASPEQAAARLARHPGACAEDMEGFAVALACALCHTPLSIVRGISNRVGERDSTRWKIPSALHAARLCALEELEA